MSDIYSLYNGIVGFRLTKKFHFEDGKGNPLAFGYLCTSVATFDENGNKNPTEIQLDSRGECDNVWLDDSISNKFTLYDASRNKIWEWTITAPGNQKG